MLAFARQAWLWAALAGLAVPGVAQIPEWYYETDGSTAVITQYAGAGGEVTVPETLDGYSVTRIGFEAFGFCSSATSITVPNGVTSIGYRAFCSASSLTNAVIGNGVTTLEGRAFVGCYHLASVRLGNGLKTLGDGAFSGCYDLTSVTIPDSVTTVGQDAFYGCSTLASVKIGEGVTTIGDEAFWQCTSLGCVTIPNSVTTIGNSAFRYCSGLTSVSLGHSVMTIGVDAFRDCNSLMGFYFRGNAPGDVWGALRDIWRADTPTAFILSDTTGWGSEFYGLPTALWNPQVQQDASFGVQAGCFGFTVTNAGSPMVVVETTTNLSEAAWAPVATNTLTGGSSYFSDADWTNHPARFYRFQMP